MGYILTPADVDTSTLIPLNNTKLDLKTAIDYLLGGQIIIVKGLEATTDADTYVRLALELPKPTTRITYTNPAKSSTAWEPYSITLDAISIHPTFLYDKDAYPFDSIFRPNDVIKYSDTDNRLVAGVVEKVYRDAKGHLYYKFTNNDQLYLLQQSGQGMYGDESNGKKPFIPVADVTKDGTIVIVRDQYSEVPTPQ